MGTNGMDAVIVVGVIVKGYRVESTDMGDILVDDIDNGDVYTVYTVYGDGLGEPISDHGTYGEAMAVAESFSDRFCVPIVM